MIGLMKLKALREEASRLSGQTVKVGGWVRTLRDSGNIAFMELNDGTSFGGVQVVLNREKLPDFETLTRLGVSAAVIVTGTVILTPEAKQPFERRRPP